MQDYTKASGHITAIIDYIDKPREIIQFPNTILRVGLATIAKSMVEPGSVHVSNMLFGDGGWDHQQGTKKVVDPDRNNLFGVTRANKTVVAQIDPNLSTQAIFTAILGYQDANNSVINEMALQLSNGDFYSMATSASFSKTDQMQITWVWRLAWV